MTSELGLFNFVIKYQTGHSNRAADALNHCPFNPSCHIMSESKANNNEVEVISYSSVCEDLKWEAHNISCAMQPILEEGDIDEIVSTWNTVSLFEQATPEKMAEEQQKDPTFKLAYQWVTAGEKSKTLAIAKIRSKAVRKYLLQFNRLTMKKGVLHWLFINNDVEYHQMVLPLKYQAQVLQLLHDGQGH